MGKAARPLERTPHSGGNQRFEFAKRCGLWKASVADKSGLRNATRNDNEPQQVRTCERDSNPLGLEVGVDQRQRGPEEPEAHDDPGDHSADDSNAFVHGGFRSHVGVDRGYLTLAMSEHSVPSPRSIAAAYSIPGTAGETDRRLEGGGRKTRGDQPDFRPFRRREYDRPRWRSSDFPRLRSTLLLNASIPHPPL